MILAGIDEAGYGPLLGPLVVGCCAFEVDADPAGELPCLWKRLGKLISKKHVRGGKKIHVNDSKQVYSPANGIKELERSVLAVSATFQPWSATLNDFLSRVADHALGDLSEYPWYVPLADESFPLRQDATSIRLFANALRVEMQRTRTQCVHLAARVLFERQLNHHIDRTRNKASTLFSTTAIHLDHLLRTYGQRGLTIFCDRQGGREHYGSLLRMMFDTWSLQIVREVEGYSEYSLLQGPHAVRIIFCEKAEAQCLPVAMASMLCKYLREAMMHRFNAFWLAHVPGLAPTAGYYTDGMRFLEQINPRRRELGISDEQLIRSR